MTQNNEHEKLDVRYFNEKLRLVLEGLPNYTRSELARELQRLSNTASPISQNEQQEAVAYADASLVCTISTYMIKELESRNENNKFPYHLWPTKLYTSPPKQIPEWIDVSYEERRVLYKSLAKGNVDNFANLLSARLRELNTAPTNTEVVE